MWDPLLSPSASGGVTTVVMGNCGVGAAPCRKEDRDFMIHLLEGVEDIPAESIDAGVKWEVDGVEWESYPEYLDALDKLQCKCSRSLCVFFRSLREAAAPAWHSSSRTTSATCRSCCR